MDGFSTHRSVSQRHVSGGVITAIGAILLGIPLYDVWDDVEKLNWALATTIAENTTFFLLAAGVTAGGLWLIRSDWATRHVAIVAKWTVAGWLAASLLFGWVVAIQLWAMGRLKPYVLAMDGVLIGTAVTFGLGLYSARTDIQRTELQWERKTSRSLESLHDVATTLQATDTTDEAYEAVLDGLETLLAPATVRIRWDGEVVAERTHQFPPPADTPASLAAAVGDRGRIEVAVKTAPAHTEQSLDIVATHLDRAVDRIEREQRLAEERRKFSLVNRALRHDLLNDLQTIQFRLPHIEETADPPDDHWAVITNRVAAMGKFIHQMREYMDLVEQDDPALNPMRVRPVVETKVERVRNANPDASVVLGDIPDVEVRANDLLGPLFENLLRNAIEHNDKTTPRVWVNATRRAGTLVVRVTDNGPGIPDAQKAAMRERGDQYDERDEGGFGLYLVSEAVAAYGGTLDIRDNEPTGTIVRVTLPLAAT